MRLGRAAGVEKGEKLTRGTEGNVVRWHGSEVIGPWKSSAPSHLVLCNSAES